MEVPFWGKIVILVLLLALLVIGVLLFQKYRSAAPQLPAATETVEEPQVIREVRLYFGDDEALFLVAETRELENCLEDEACLQQTVQALLDGPSGDLIPIMPKNVAIRSVSEQEGVATIDFSREFVTGHPGGSVSELFTVYGLANTLADNFPYIRQVRILVEGQAIETLKGHVDLSRAVAADFRFVRRLDAGTGTEAGAVRGAEEVTADFPMAEPGEAETFYPEAYPEASSSPLQGEMPLPESDLPEEEMFQNDGETPTEVTP
ncbi:MAG: GerMN domain-containing protein [Syntrophotaleaceae bacterium]